MSGRVVGSKNLKIPSLIPSRRKYVCNVNGCKAEVTGYALGDHYKR